MIRFKQVDVGLKKDKQIDNAGTHEDLFSNLMNGRQVIEKSRMDFKII